MKRIILIAAILFILLVTVIFSLVRFSQKEAEKDEIEQSIEPEWYYLQDSQKYLYIYGKATKNNIEASQQAAFLNATSESPTTIAAETRKVFTEIVNQAQIHDQTSITGIDKIITKTSGSEFSGLTIAKRRTYIYDDGKHQTFVRLKVPRHEVLESLLELLAKDEPLSRSLEACSSFQTLIETSQPD